MLRKKICKEDIKISKTNLLLSFCSIQIDTTIDKMPNGVMAKFFEECVVKPQCLSWNKTSYGESFCKIKLSG